MAFSIVRHAFAMVFGNLGQALRLSIGPFLIAALIVYALATSMNVGMVSLAFMAMNPVAADPMILLFVLLAVIIAALVSAWVAVAWHRFILLEEYVDLLPQLKDRPIGGYILTSLAVSFWVFLASFVAGIVLGFVLAVTATAESFFFGFIGGALIGALSSYVWFRLALTLPAIAIGKPMRIADARETTHPMSSTIWQVVVILVVINMILRTGAGLVAPGSVMVQLVLGGAVTWVTFMVGLSLLTTFYGHLVEKRDLVD